MAKFADHMEKIAGGVTQGYQKIEDGVVTGYKKVENAFVSTFMANRGRGQGSRNCRHRSSSGKDQGRYGSSRGCTEGND